MSKNSFFSGNLLIKSRSRLLDLGIPKLMSIFNLTPDSFHDGGIFNNIPLLLKRAEIDISNGATILDLGACSSRPRANEVSIEVEWERLLPALRSIRKEFPEIFISIDTYRSVIAARSAQEGADLINDISAGSLDSEMMNEVAKTELPYIIMHMRGNPTTMMLQTEYADICLELITYFRDKITEAERAGIRDIIIDPGFGFAKTLQQNYELLARMGELRILEKPIMAGISRKSMVYKLLETDHVHALNGSTAAHIIALQNGASLLRVHDIKEAAEALKIWQACEPFSNANFQMHKKN